MTSRPVQRTFLGIASALMVFASVHCSTTDGTQSTNVFVVDASTDASRPPSTATDSGIDDAPALGNDGGPSASVAPPVGLLYAQPVLSCVKGSPCSLPAPSSKGGEVAVYTISPALPIGLHFDTATGAISGAPAVVAALSSFTVTATNAGGSTTTTLGVVVDDQPPGTIQYGQSSLLCTKGSPCTLAAPTINGGGSVSAFTTTAALPSGMSIHAVTGAIMGTPTALVPKTTFTVKAQGAGGTSTTTVDITVNDLAPTAVAYASSTLTCIKGSPCLLAAPTNSGGKVDVFSISPALPTGLSLDASTGALSGIPSAVAPVGIYVITATNTGGTAKTFLTLAVNDIALGAIVYPSSVVCAQNTPCTVAAPTVSGQATFSVTPALPSGLVLDANSGAITGTPTATSSPVVYTITAINSGGTSSATLTLSVLAPLALISFSPTSASPGASVTVTGTGFDPTLANNLVTVGGVSAAVTAVTATTLAFTVPSAAVSGSIVVTTPSGGAKTSATPFVVPVRVTSFTPHWGDPGATIQVLGSGFGNTNATVTINGKTATVSSVTPTSLTVTVPTGASGGKVTVTVGSQSGTSATNFLSGTISHVAGTGGMGTALPANTLATNWPMPSIEINAQLSGKLLVAGNNNHAMLYSVDLASGNLTALAGQRGVCLAPGWLGQPTGSGSATSAVLCDVRGIAVASSGDVYFTDGSATSGCPIRRISGGIISTFAGGASCSFSGEGVQATSASFASPESLALDETNGFLYVAESGRIRRISLSTGVVTTIAGNGTSTSTGDNGPASAATVCYSRGRVALDAQKNLYFSEYTCHRVRKITITAGNVGNITTVAGTGTSGFAGDGGLATSARLSNPAGLAFDASGNLFIAEESNHRLRRMDGATGILTTYAGNGVSNTSGADGAQATSTPMPLLRAVDVDASGNVYVSGLDYKVRRIAPNGAVTTVAGNGKAYLDNLTDPKAAVLTSPSGLSFDGSGNVLIADRLGRAVRRLSAAGTSLTTLAGSGSLVTFDARAIGTDITQVRSVFFNKSTSALLTSGPNVVWLVDPGGTIGRAAGTGSSGSVVDAQPALSSNLSAEGQALYDSAGNLWIADTLNHMVRRVDATTGIMTRVVGTGTSGYSGDGGQATLANISSPTGLAFDAASNLYVAEGCRVRRVDPNGIITTFAGGALFGYSGDGLPAKQAQLSGGGGQLGFDNSGNLYVVTGNGHAVRVIDALGIIRTFAGDSTGIFGYSGNGGKATAAKLWVPWGVAADADGVVYISDTNNNVIRRVN